MTAAPSDAEREIADLRRANAALQAALATTETSHQQYRTMLSAIPTLVWRTSADGNAEFFSARWYEYTGMSFEQASGAGWTSAFHPDDLARLSIKWAQIVASRQPSEVEARFRRHDGQYRWHLMRSVPLFDDAGQIVSWCGTNTDIDELKRAESYLAGERKLFELGATGEPLQTILEAACGIVEDLEPGVLVAIWLLNDDGQRLRLCVAPSVPENCRDELLSDVLSADAKGAAKGTIDGEAVFGHGLHGCFSTPITRPGGKNAGAFCMYARDPREISPREARTAEQFTHLIGSLVERKRVEDELRHSEALLAEGQRISQTGTWVWQLATNRMAWSVELCRIFGFGGDQRDASLDLFLQTVHPHDAAWVRAVLSDAVSRACEFSIEYRINLAGGSMKHIHSQGRPVVGARGQVDEFIGTAIDISYRYEAKLALENELARAVASEDQLRSFIDNLPGLAWTAGPNGEAEFLSQGWLDYVGASAEEAKGPGWANFIHPDDIGQMIETWQRLIATRQPGEQQARLRRFDGSYRWFSFRGAPVLDPWGHVAKWYGVNIDIEDQRRADAEMRKLVSIIENSTDCIGYARSPEEIGYVNSAWRKVAGLGPDEDLSRYTLADFMPAADYHRFVADILPALQSDGHWDGEQTLHNIRTGAPTPVHQTIFFIADATTGKRIGMATICRDITERKRAEHELRRSEADLRKAQSELAHVTRVTTMGELAASIAHEVNQPIAAVVINGNASLRWLAREPSLSKNVAEARDAVARIVRDGTRAGEVIGRIRALFKKAENAKTLLHIGEVIREVIELARGEVDRRRVALRLELASDLPPVSGDRVQLQQVLLNLILNATEAMSATDDRSRHLVIAARPLGTHEVEVSVRDSGPGLGAEDMEQLFAAFYTTKPGGLGMGLSISRSIVEAHDGRLWATCNDGPGATFQFTLPVGARVRPSMAPR